MPIRKRASAERKAPLRPDKLAKEAQTWRRAAKQALDPAVKLKFEEMAEDREIVARAIEELENEPAAEEYPGDGAEGRSSKP